MKRKETQRSVPNQFNKVFDGRNRRVRGLWERNRVYYAQVRVQSRRGRVVLEHANTIAEAVAAMQALRVRIHEGKFVPPVRPSKGAQTANTINTQVTAIPEKNSVQILPANGAEEPLDKRMRDGHMRHSADGLDFQINFTCAGGLS